MKRYFSKINTTVCFVAFLTAILIAGCRATSDADSQQAGLAKTARLLQAFGYSHVPASKISSYRLGGNQVYAFNDGGGSSEIVMSNKWPKQTLPVAGSFYPASDGPKIDRPMVDRLAANRAFGPLMGVIGANYMNISSFELTSKYSSHVKRHEKSKLALVKGTMRLKSGVEISFYAFVIPSTGRFLTWGASEVRRK